MKQAWVKLNVHPETRTRLRVLKARRGDPDLDHTLEKALSVLEGETQVAGVD